jgi:hypothetical protein
MQKNCRRLPGRYLASLLVALLKKMIIKGGLKKSIYE